MSATPPNGPRRRRRRRETPTEQVRVIRWGAGHPPGSVTVKADRPVELVFERLDGTTPCEYVTIPALGWVSTLRDCARCSIRLAPLAAGTYSFASVDGRLRGSLRVEP